MHGCIMSFHPQANTLSRLCTMLLLQPHPVLVSICLRPYRLHQADESFLTGRLQVCEKYAQLTLDVREAQRGRQAYLKNQAQALHKQCDLEYLQLLDAAFLLKVQLASTQPLAPELLHQVGTTITEHAGAPQLIESDLISAAFLGGYDVYRPQTPDEARRARRNLQEMAFDPVAPGLAPAGMEHLRYLFDVSEAVAAFRLPLPLPGEFPGLATTMYQPKAAPVDLPKEGLFLGHHWQTHRPRPVYLPHPDRRRHLYVIGKTGTGKSTFLLNLILQDLQAGFGLGLIDPHGEVVDEILPCIPKEREQDVVYFDPQDADHVVGLNLLQCQNTFEKEFAINYLIEVFDILYDLRQTGGPIFEQYMRNALQLLLDQPEDFTATVLEVPRLFQDPDFRRLLLDRTVNPYARRFWQQEAERAGGDLSLRNVSPYITSKLTRFIYNDILRAILGQRRSTIDFRTIMDQRKILLVDLRKGLLGETNSQFVGMLVVGKIFAATLSRTLAAEKSSLPDFYLYVDECQNLATPTMANILSEARKYGLALVLANQYIGQLKDYVLEGILGNVGSLVSFRVGVADAEVLSKEFARVVSENDLLGLSNFTSYVRLLVGGSVTAPFDLSTVLPAKASRPEAVDRIRQLSRTNYTRPWAEVEAEVRHYWL